MTHVEGNVDPIRDLNIIAHELRAKDIQLLEGEVSRLEKIVRQIDKTKKGDLDTCLKLLEMCKDGKNIRDGHYGCSEIPFINTLQLLTAKPSIVLANMTPKDYLRKKNKWLKPLVDWTKENGGMLLIPFSAALEQDIEAMSPEEYKAWCEENKATSAVPKVVLTGFRALNLIYFFTAGSDEVKAWTITKGYKAPQAAGTIHTDFEKGFICADIYNYEDWIASDCNEQKCKDTGKMRQQGKTYVVKDGDVCFFKFNRPSAPKKK